MSMRSLGRRVTAESCIKRSARLKNVFEISPGKTPQQCQSEQRVEKAKTFTL
jgi:hypothetical protein